MTRKAALTIILMGMAVSAVIVIATISSSIKRQRIRAEDIASQASAQTTTKPVEIGYFLKAYEGEIAVFRGDSATPYKKLGVSVAFMSDQDKILLTDGIFVRTESELKKLIEDYTS